jgi:segregation and condensation protein A
LEGLPESHQGVEGQPQVKEPERFHGHKIQLPIYEGPLDLLLYLVRAHKYDIFDIPIYEVTSQFVEYITLMNEVEADYAGDFLVTAATLMQIKSRMLLPRQESANEEVLEQEELDPRVELVKQLLEYQRIQEAAEDLREKREARADLFPRPPGANFRSLDVDTAESLLLADVSSFDLLTALRRVLKRMEEKPIAVIRREPFSLPDRLKALQGRIGRSGEAVTFGTLCDDCESRLEVVITFLAVLELIRRGRVVVRQLTLFDEIWIENPN